MSQACVTDWGNAFALGHVVLFRSSCSCFCVVLFPSSCSCFCGLSWVAKMADNHLGSYWVNDPYQLSVSVVVYGKCIQDSKENIQSTLLLAPLTHWSRLITPLFKWQSVMKRWFFKDTRILVLLCNCAILSTIHSQNTFNNTFVTIKQENKVEYPCAFGVA